MKIGIFSDIHANAEAFASTRSAIVRENVDMVVSLGDTVGYGGSPEECCRAVRSFASISILGNHDAAVSERMNYNYYYDAAKKVLDEHARQLSNESMQWLSGLPYTYNLYEHEILLCHGSPLKPELFDYVFEIEHAQKLLDIYDRLPLVTFIGHSHLYRCYILEYNDVFEITDVKVKIGKDAPKHIISVGSVGQPRDMDNRAGYVVYDTETSIVRFKRVEYDIESASDKILNMKGDRNFSERLLLGW